MPIARFRQGSEPPRLGKVFVDHLVDLSVAAPGLPRDIPAFLAAGAPARAVFDAVTENAPGRVALSGVTLLAPVAAPEKFLAIGMNYADHGVEAVRLGLELPKTQLWFNKQVSCINDPYGEIVAPAVSEKLDYEGELAVVIGRTCRNVPVERALEMVGGYMIANDVSARDWQAASQTMTLGKSFDTHGPLGPWLTLAGEIGDPQSLALETRVNGEIRQKATTAHMIHDVAHQIAHLSKVMTLKPGDVLATGTPSGVGAAMTPPSFMSPGDVVRISIQGLGHIENRVIADPAA